MAQQRVEAVFGAGLQLPVIAAPMFLVSGLALVQACCRSGIVGSFPAANARTVDGGVTSIAPIGASALR